MPKSAENGEFSISKISQGHENHENPKFGKVSPDHGKRSYFFDFSIFGFFDMILSSLAALHSAKVEKSENRDLVKCSAARLLKIMSKNPKVEKSKKI